MEEFDTGILISGVISSFVFLISFVFIWLSSKKVQKIESQLYLKSQQLTDLEVELEVSKKKVKTTEAEVNSLNIKYSSIVDMESHIQTLLEEAEEQVKTNKAKSEHILANAESVAIEIENNKKLKLEKTISDLDGAIDNKISEINSLRKSYQQKKVVFDSLIANAAIYDETIELAELGFYKPSFSFEHSEKYKEKITQVRADQKQMITDKTAIICTTEWTVEGSKAKGNTMTNRNIRMTARAFNNECDAAISKIKWNNAQRMIERINKAFDAINKLNESNQVFIEREYLNLKIDELKLTHEYYEKKQQEKEEQAEIRQQMREEAKLEKEMTDAFKEEEKFQVLLDKATKQAQEASGDKLSKLEEKIAKLNDDLAQAHQKSERAKSMAEQTKVGYVYVISNKGSFGENIYKIGMTRRLEPLDRVKELGDASVPFLFDVHAMIYTENAPELEKSLHRKFNDRRLNLVNNRKEFFNVGLIEIQNMVKEKHSNAEFRLTAEAREYNESQAIRAQKKEDNLKLIKFPDCI